MIRLMGELSIGPPPMSPKLVLAVNIQVPYGAKRQNWFLSTWLQYLRNRRSLDNRFLLLGCLMSNVLTD